MAPAYNAGRLTKPPLMTTTYNTGRRYHMTKQTSSVFVQPIPTWVVLLMFVFVWLAQGIYSPAFATEPVGRPDPTGQQRYEAFGPELPYKGAQVVASLPEGATECGPADELIGASVMNSTREGRAVFAKLTDKATTSVAGTRLFLCRCAKGFNELFLIERSSSPASAVAQAPPVPAPAPAPVAVAPPAPVVPVPPAIVAAAEDCTPDTSVPSIPSAREERRDKRGAFVRTTVVKRQCRGTMVSVSQMEANKGGQKIELAKVKVQRGRSWASGWLTTQSPRGDGYWSDDQQPQTGRVNVQGSSFGQWRGRPNSDGKQTGTGVNVTGTPGSSYQGVSNTDNRQTHGGVNSNGSSNTPPRGTENRDTQQTVAGVNKQGPPGSTYQGVSWTDYQDFK